MHTKQTEFCNVQVQVVTYNSRGTIGKCLDTVFNQTLPATRVIVIDNASTDGCADIVEGQYAGVTIIRNSVNTGYTGGHNIGFKLATSDVKYVLTLNPDVELTPMYVELAVNNMESNVRIGGVTGKLLRKESDSVSEPVIDSTGLIMQRFSHVRDRDSGKKDIGQRDKSELVWGVSGAAALYRVSMLNDLVYEERVFDETFLIYKEDVDLCWRAHRQAWDFLYNPEAIAYHKRSWVKGRKMSFLVTSHSFANQIALIIRHVPISIELVLSILVELIRYLLLMLHQPKVAIRSFKLICKFWNHNWKVRKTLLNNESESLI